MDDAGTSTNNQSYTPDIISGTLNQLQNALLDTATDIAQPVIDFVNDHSVAILSVRGGFILAGALDVIITPDKISVYLGGGLGAGLSATAAAGIKSGSTDGITGKLSFAGGFGGGGRATFRASEAGLSGAATAGLAGGLSASGTVGYTWGFERGL